MRSATARKTVGEKNDDVFGNGLFGRRVEVPANGLFAFGALHRHFILAGLLDLDVADHEGRTFGVRFLGRPEFVAREGLRKVVSVDPDRDILAVDDGVEFDLEVELGVRHETGGVHGIDLGRLGVRARDAQKGRRERGGEVFLGGHETLKKFVHGRDDRVPVRNGV